MSNPTLSSLIFMVLFVITLGWMGDTILGLLHTFLFHGAHRWWQELLIGVLPFIVLLGLGWLRWKWAQKKSVKLKMEASEITPHAGIIMFLSSINKDQHIKRLEQSDWTVLNEPYFSWKPCQRGLEIHKSRLNTVWVICTPESGKQYPWFEAMFKELYPNVSFVRKDVANFEDISELTYALEDILTALPSGIDESDVVIDVTGGQKPASIAGMMVSLVNGNRQVQYVQTNAPFSVKTYTYEINAMGKHIKSKE